LADLTYTKLGSGVYVITPDGYPIKALGTVKPDTPPEEAIYTVGNGRYKCPDTYAIVHISTVDSKIFLVVGRRLNKIQQSCIMQLCMKMGKGYLMYVHSCDKSILYDVDKLVSAYNLFAEA
jgi:hypothetical protein